MSLNCEPGDIAYIVRNTSGTRCIGTLIGTPVEVEHVESHSFGAVWHYKGRTLRCRNCGGGIYGLLDADLQPMRRTPRAETVYEFIDDAMRPHRQVEHAR